MTTPVVDRGTAPGATTSAPGQAPGIGERLRRGLSFQSIGAVYVLLAMIVVFSIWVPDTFPKVDTIRQVLNNNSVNSLAAMSLIIPLAAGVFDISVPYTMTLSGIMCTYTIVHTDLPIAVAIAIALAISIGVGIFNGIIVVVFKIDSLIGTLASGFLIVSVVKWRTGLRTVTSGELNGSFQRLGNSSIARFQAPVFYAIVVAAVLWYVLEHTATGRRIYATGFNRDAAKLATVRTERLRFGALVTSGFLAGIAGIVLAAKNGNGSPTGGNEYLLPAFAAVFLGATQLKGGRFNAWGTIIGILLLGTGTTGLGLAHQESWVQDQFKGWVLIASLAVTGLQVRSAGGSQIRALLRNRFGRRTAPDTTGDPAAVNEPMKGTA